MLNWNMHNIVRVYMIMVGRGAFLTCCCSKQHVPDRRTEENRMKR